MQCEVRIRRMNPAGGSLVSVRDVVSRHLHLRLVTGFTEQDDISRVAQYRLRSTLRGTDGSTLQLVLSGKLAMNANGVVVVSRDTYTCE